MTGCASLILSQAVLESTDKSGRLRLARGI
jgi:hypothetical protein